MVTRMSPGELLLGTVGSHSQVSALENDSLCWSFMHHRMKIKTKRTEKCQTSKRVGLVGGSGNFCAPQAGDLGMLDPVCFWWEPSPSSSHPGVRAAVFREPRFLSVHSGV